MVMLLETEAATAEASETMTAMVKAVAMAEIHTKEIQVRPGVEIR